jgi:hypothetical protein
MDMNVREGNANEPQISADTEAISEERSLVEPRSGGLGEVIGER